MQVLHFFPDTNLFIQCRPLEELDWTMWADFDEVHLVVCRPVQREIDSQKNRGNSRVGKRARRASALFKDIITGADGYKLVREAGPQVKLMVEPSWIPDPKLKGRLDYTKADDEVVGCLYAFRAAHPGADARLLSHDPGPMATAKMLSLPFIAVPDEWLVPPESTEDQRERNRLQAELARLRKAEPQFQISCIDGGKETDSLRFDCVRYEPLSDEDVAELLERLRTRFPLATDFGPRDPAERRSPLGLSGMKEVYTPASDEEIAAYTEEKYPEWLERCESVLRTLHSAFQHEAGNSAS